ncbi:MAG: alginate export family protein, partial [Gemmatimonadales bacterium]
MDKIGIRRRWCVASAALLVIIMMRGVAASASLDVSASHRTRYEHLENPFAGPARELDGALFLRTLAAATVHFEPIQATVELADSRVYLADDDVPLSTSHVDAVEVLQALIGADVRDAFAAGAKADIRAGRMTIDVGSRRLVARNNFRNTINAFTGIDARWQGAGGTGVRGLVAMPVERRPAARGDLADNDIRIDREMTDVFLWGGFCESDIRSVHSELYLFGLHEDDSHRTPTRNRNLLTYGARAIREPQKGRIGFEVEATLQTGTSRASTRSTDTIDLNHLAWFAHASLGYCADMAWSPRLRVAYDYASGDRDPGDDDQG